MSDVSKTNDLIAEARKCAPGDDATELAVIVHRLADALEAAARVPVQGEPNDDREATEAEIQKAARVLHIARCCNLTQGSLHAGPDSDDVFAAGVVLNAVPRAVVPDAASDWDCSCKCGHLFHKECSETCTGPLIQVGAERDAALAAIERVRAIHYETEGVHCHTVCAHRHCKDDSEDQHRWPCPTVAALDGAPEPEVKP